MHFKRSITFRLKDAHREDGAQMILLRASWCGLRYETTTGYTVSPGAWDSKNQRVTGAANSDGVPVSKINNDLATLRGYLDEIFNRYEFISKRPPTKDELKVLFEDMAGRAKIEDLGESLFLEVPAAFDRFISANSPGWEPATLTGYKSVRSHVLELFSGVNLEELEVADIDKYQAYLFSERAARNSYVQRSVNKLKTFLRWCKHEGLYSGTAHEHKTRLKGVNNKEVIVLTPSELEVIMRATFSDKQKHLERVRDLLVFSCFTGLRYSDVQSLTPANISDGVINLVTKKTADHLTIEINKVAAGIIEKYKGLKTGKLLPTLSNQKANEELKELGRLLGLDAPTQTIYYNNQGRQIETRPKYELLSTHIGRRTFISNALSLGVPVSTVMSWTGHKDFAAMKPYIKLVDKMKRKQMGVFDRFSDSLEEE